MVVISAHNVAGNISKDTPHQAWLVLWANDLGMCNQPLRPTRPPALSGWEMNTVQSVMMLYSWWVKADVAYSICRWTCRWQVKLWSLINRCYTWVPWAESIIQCYTNVLFTLPVYLLTPSHPTCPDLGCVAVVGQCAAELSLLNDAIV